MLQKIRRGGPKSMLQKIRGQVLTAALSNRTKAHHAHLLLPEWAVFAALVSWAPWVHALHFSALHLHHCRLPLDSQCVRMFGREASFVVVSAPGWTAPIELPGWCHQPLI